MALEGTQLTLPHGETLMQHLRAQFSVPLARCTVTAGDEALNVRRLTIQVIDRLGREAAGRWVVLVYISATSGGDPSATGNTVSVVAGTGTLETVTSNAAYRLITDADGQAQIDLTVSGSATRYVSTIVEGKVRESAAVTFAA